MKNEYDLIKEYLKRQDSLMKRMLILQAIGVWDYSKWTSSTEESLGTQDNS